MGLFGPKPLYKYKPLEKYKADIQKEIKVLPRQEILIVRDSTFSLFSWIFCLSLIYALDAEQTIFFGGGNRKYCVSGVTFLLILLAQYISESIEVQCVL